MFKSVVHYFLKIIAACWRGSSNVILSRKSGTLLPCWCAAARSSLRHLESVGLAHHRGVGKLRARNLCAGWWGREGWCSSHFVHLGLRGSLNITHVTALSRWLTC